MFKFGWDGGVDVRCLSTWSYSGCCMLWVIPPSDDVIMSTPCYLYSLYDRYSMYDCDIHCYLIMWWDDHLRLSRYTLNLWISLRGNWDRFTTKDEHDSPDFQELFFSIVVAILFGFLVLLLALLTPAILEFPCEMFLQGGAIFGKVCYRVTMV